MKIEYQEQTRMLCLNTESGLDNYQIGVLKQKLKNAYVYPRGEDNRDLRVNIADVLEALTS